MEKPRLCPICGKHPTIERWGSNGVMYMVKCNNPDCPVPVVSYPTGHNLEEVIKRWNRRASDGKID